MPGRHMLTAGFEDPIASITAENANAIEAGLVGLRTFVRAGINYPVVFAFEHAGPLRTDLPVNYPDDAPRR